MKPAIAYKAGDMFPVLAAMTSGTIFLPHVCNDKGAFGAGFVVPLSRAYPKAKEEYVAWFKFGAGFVVPLSRAYPKAKEEYVAWFKGKLFAPSGANGALVMGNTQLVLVQEKPARIVVCNMIAQTLGGVRPLNYGKLVNCMESVVQAIMTERAIGTGKAVMPEIHAPLFGSDLAGGNWLFIEELIRDIWIAANIPVTIYYLPERIPSNWTPPSEQ